MTKIIQILLISIFIFCTSATTFAQEKKNNDPDITTKEILYAKYKKEVLAYDKNDFDKLFFEFFSKQGQEIALTKEEFYTYTIKIAIYSEKLGMLYKSQKEESQKTKQEWFDKMYQDYLNERNSQK